LWPIRETTDGGAILDDGGRRPFGGCNGVLGRFHSATEPAAAKYPARQWTSICAVTSQGDYAQRSDVIRSTYTTLTGTGVTVGVLSDSYNCYAVFAADGVTASGTDGYASNGFLATAVTDVSTGDLPSSVNVLKEATCMQTATQYTGYPTQLPFGDEGGVMGNLNESACT
jgi:hypothetical protein